MATPRTQTCDGGSSMNSLVQSPAREMSRRKPDRPGVLTVANECHSRNGLRLIPTAEAMAGVTPWSKRTITACEEGRSTVTGTPQPEPRRGDAHFTAVAIAARSRGSVGVSPTTVVLASSWARVTLAPREQRWVTVPIRLGAPEHLLAYWRAAGAPSGTGAWVTPRGDVPIYVGSSSEDIRRQGTLTVR